MWQIGLAANRPAPGVSGRVYFASDTGQVSLDRTSTWLDIGVVGPTGPTGPTGPQGSQGIQGIQGPAGSGSAPNIKLNGTQVVAGASNFDFSSAFTATESPTGEGNIGANFGSAAGTIAQGNHAHAATAITYAGSTNLSSANVEAALDELDTEKAASTDARFGLPSQIVVAGARVSWTNVPSAITEYFGVSAYRTKCDLGSVSEMRTTVTVDGGTTVPSGTVLRVQYSTDASTWNDTHGTLSVVNMAVDTAGTKDTGWFTPVAGLKASNIYLRAVAQSGNGSTTLVAGNVHVYVR